MASDEGDWLRVRGIGRERFAGYLSAYLENLGYTVVKEEGTDAPVSHLRGHLERMNPAVPPGASSLAFRLYPTSGGAAVIWESPLEIPADQMARMDRLVRELTSHLERAIATESHATAKVVRPTEPRLPWAPTKSPSAGSVGPVSSQGV